MRTKLIKWSVLTVNEFFLISLLTGLFLSLLIKFNYKRTALWGGALVLLALSSALILNTGIIDSRSKFFEGILSSSSVISSVGLMAGLFFINRRARIGNTKVLNFLAPAFSVLLALIILPGFIEFMNVLERLLFQSNMFNTSVLWDGLGVFVGLLLSIVLTIAVVRNSKRATSSAILIYFSILIILSLVRQATVSLQAFMLDGIIPMNQSLFSILIALINGQTIIQYVTFALGFLFVPFVVFGKNRHVIPSDISGHAEQRKHRMSQKIEIRWIAVFAFILVAVYFLQGAQAYQEREKQVNLASAKAVSAKGGQIIIPLKDISDKDLKRFSYQGKENKVTFLAVSKGSGVYGVALDACQICGPAGFYQDKKNVICIKCQSVVNRSTVGFPGGCNPIPLEHKIENGKLIIDEKVLVQNEKIFKK